MWLAIGLAISLPAVAYLALVFLFYAVDQEDGIEE